tara:strand:- start:1172 stop:1804 length:633 start_codon:yes stop_codon:yes gene_type:complete
MKAFFLEEFVEESEVFIGVIYQLVTDKRISYDDFGKEEVYYFEKAIYRMIKKKEINKWKNPIEREYNLNRAIDFFKSEGFKFNNKGVLSVEDIKNFVKWENDYVSENFREEYSLDKISELNKKIDRIYNCQIKLLSKLNKKNLLNSEEVKEIIFDNEALISIYEEELEIDENYLLFEDSNSEIRNEEKISEYKDISDISLENCEDEDLDI